MGLKTKHKEAGWKSLIVKLVIAGVIALSCWLIALRFTSRSHITRFVRHTHQSKRVSVGNPDDHCHAEEHTEYEGALVRSGENNLKNSAGECCESCHDAEGCNVWVWCGQLDGCGPGRAFKQCWLKKQADFNILYIRGMRHPSVLWTSGSVFPDSALQEARAQDAQRIEALVQNQDLPMVFLDVAIKGTLIGRITFVLFNKESPRAAENFRALCTGEKGVAPPGREGAGQPYHFKGKAFYRIIDQFIDQTGAGTDSVFGGLFKDDAGGLQLKHNRRGLLSMANRGPDTNGSHFSIMIGPAPHLNGHYTIFGEVVDGFEVVEAINKLSRGQPDNFAGPDAGAVIVESGQLRCGNPCGAPDLYKGTLNEHLHV